MSNQKNIVIVGGGFCGTMTAVNLIRDTRDPIKIILINSGAPFICGVAYNTYSRTHLLNVAAGNMSAFVNDLAHFTNWVRSKVEYSEFEPYLLATTFLPRNLYGEYLKQIWETTIATKRNDTELNVIDDYVTDLELLQNNQVKTILKKGSALIADYIVLATGNSLPRNPPIVNTSYYSSGTFFRNPWSKGSVSDLNHKGDILIIGNGLTMVDTVIGLIENGFKNKIYSISTNGFGVLPHRHFGIKYNGLTDELQNQFDLNSLVGILNKHIKKVRKLGISAEPVIDSIRPFSQKIWQSFTLEEKKKFLTKFRYMWGVARHRLPVFIYDIIENLRISGQLEVYQGKLLDITENGNEVSVTFHNVKKRSDETLKVQRVINCTGPETSIYKTLNPLLNKLAEKNIISADPLELGINADISTYNIITREGKKSHNIFTLGTNLKGMLWETIAVPELRQQCKQLSDVLLQACKEE
jgi:uncharacterized NAD(P)/FAD-binding protein YdhS